MARGDLHRLAVQAHEFLAQDTSIYREFYVDKLVHKYSVSYEQVRSETFKQIGYKFTNITAADKSKISRAVTVYVTELFDAFRLSKVTSATIDLEGSKYNFIATITQVGKTTPFAIINNIKKEPQKDLVDRLNEILKPHESGHKNFSSDNFLDSGHKVGVSDRFIDEGLSSIYDSARNSKAVASLVANSLRLKMASKFVGNSKVFTVEVSEESARDNRSKGSAAEKARLKATRTKLRAWIESNSKWAEQKGSDSELEFIEKVVIGEFSKIKGYKGRRAIKPSTAASKATVVVSSKSKASKSNDTMNLKVRPPKSRINIVALINLKLTEEIKSRMTYPRLENRTGRFAESVSVISEARGVLSYTYQKSPYQVFEPGTGRSPWASTDRDPRSLIDESIRAIAATIAANKFYTRRV